MPLTTVARSTTIKAMKTLPEKLVVRPAYTNRNVYPIGFEIPSVLDENAKIFSLQAEAVGQGGGEAENRSLADELVHRYNAHAEVKAILQAIDKLTCNCPCMSLQAQKDFDDCHDANEYRVALAGVIIEIRNQARVAIAQAERGTK